jgi:hypothetical protein
MRLNLASVARLASIAIVASLFGRARRPRLLPRHRVASRPLPSRRVPRSLPPSRSPRTGWLSRQSRPSRPDRLWASRRRSSSRRSRSSRRSSPPWRNERFPSRRPRSRSREKRRACSGRRASRLAFHGPLSAVPEAVHLGTFERAVVHSALVDHSFSPLSRRVRRFCVAFRDSRSSRQDCARRKIFARLCSIALIVSIGASKIDGSTLLFVGVRLLRSSTFRRNLRSPQPSRSPRFCWLSCRSRPLRTDQPRS